MFFLQSWKFEVYQLIKTANCHIDLSYKIIETDLKKLFLIKFSHNKNVSANISRVLQNFKLILFVVIYCVTKILTICNIFLFKLQLPAYTAYGSMQKITNLIVRHLTRPYFQESCGSEMLLWRCYTTKEASRFRKKSPKWY